MWLFLLTFHVLWDIQLLLYHKKKKNSIWTTPPTLFASFDFGNLSLSCKRSKRYISPIHPLQKQ